MLLQFHGIGISNRIGKFKIPKNAASKIEVNSGTLSAPPPYTASLTRRSRAQSWHTTGAQLRSWVVSNKLEPVSVLRGRAGLRRRSARAIREERRRVAI